MEGVTTLKLVADIRLELLLANRAFGIPLIKGQVIA